MIDTKKRRSNIAYYVICFLCVAAVIVLDQVSKFLAVKYLMPVSSVPLIKDVLHLTYVENRGAAFGMLQDHRWVFMIVSTVMPSDCRTSDHPA